MDYLLLVLRLLHILSAVLWVGMMFFTVFFLVPAVQDAGPDGGKVMGALQKRGVMNFLPATALVAVVTGTWLYWRASLGFEPAYVHSATGAAFALGGLAAIVAFVIGLAAVRPSLTRAAGIMQSLASETDEAERSIRLAEAQRLRARGRTAGRVVVSLLLFSASAMAVARYL